MYCIRRNVLTPSALFCVLFTHPSWVRLQNRYRTLVQIWRDKILFTWLISCVTPPVSERVFFLSIKFKINTNINTHTQSKRKRTDLVALSTEKLLLFRLRNVYSVRGKELHSALSITDAIPSLMVSKVDRFFLFLLFANNLQSKRNNQTWKALGLSLCQKHTHTKSERSTVRMKFNVLVLCVRALCATVLVCASRELDYVCVCLCVP